MTVDITLWRRRSSPVPTSAWASLAQIIQVLMGLLTGLLDAPHPPQATSCARGSGLEGLAPAKAFVAQLSAAPRFELVEV